MELGSATLETVRKLLAKAESTDNDHERLLLNEKAAQLIAKYGIDEAMLSAASPGREHVVSKIIKVDAPYGLDKITLLHTVARKLRANGVRYGKTQYTIVGFPSDISRVEMIYSSLLVQMATGVARAREHVPYGEDLRTFSKSYYQGFISAVAGRLATAEREATTESSKGTPGTAVALANREDDVNREMSRLYGNISGGTRGKVSTGSGRLLGHSDGSRANLGTTSLGRSATAIQG